MSSALEWLRYNVRQWLGINAMAGSLITHRRQIDDLLAFKEQQRGKQ